MVELSVKFNYFNILNFIGKLLTL